MKKNTHSIGGIAALFVALFSLITILGSPATAVAQDSPLTPLSKTQFLDASSEAVWWASGNPQGMELGAAYELPTTGISSGFWWFNQPVHVTLSLENDMLTYSKRLTSGSDFLNATISMPIGQNGSSCVLVGMENTSSLSGDVLEMRNVKVNLLDYPDFSVALGEFKGVKIDLSSDSPPVFLVEADVIFRTGSGGLPSADNFRFDFVASQVPEPSVFALFGLGVAAMFFSAKKRRSH